MCNIILVNFACIGGIKREGDTMCSGGDLNQTKKRRSRWGEKAEVTNVPPLSVLGNPAMPPGKTKNMLLMLQVIGNRSINFIVH